MGLFEILLIMMGPIHLDIKIQYGYLAARAVRQGLPRGVTRMELNGTIFIQIFIFVVALLWLSKSLFEPIIRLFEERDRRISGAKSESEQLLTKAQEKSDQFDREYNKAKEKAREFLAHIKANNERDQSDKLALCKASVLEKLKASERDLEEQSKKAHTRLDADAQVIAQDIVNRLVSHHA